MDKHSKCGCHTKEKSSCESSCGCGCNSGAPKSAVNNQWASPAGVKVENYKDCTCEKKRRLQPIISGHNLKSVYRNKF